jgi:hypothetical protein
MAGEGERFQIEHGYADYTAEELLEQAQANTQALLIGTFVFLRQREIPVAAWTGTLSELFGRAWGEPRPWDAAEFLDAMLTNLRALGAQVETADLGEGCAEAVTTGFPALDLCAMLGVLASEVDAYNDVAAGIARARGLSWTWRREGERTRYVVARAGA